MKLPDSILFVGAHCDDIELLAGGLLAASCRSGRHVGVLVFSDHRGVVDAEKAAFARKEFEGNLQWLTSETGTFIENHTGLLLPACQGRFEAERARLYEAMEALRDKYSLVITHPPTDTNQDHRQVAAEAARVFKAHSTLLAGEFPSNDLGDFKPQVFVPLDEWDLAAKVRMVDAFGSQQFGGRPYFSESVIRSLAVVRGSQIRAPAAEAFAVSGRLQLVA